MKNALVLPVVLMGQLVAGTASAQGSGKDVRIFQLSGPQLGVRLDEVDAEAVSRLKLREEKGALVTEVLANSAAEKAGLQKDDVIVRFQGESVLTATQLSRLVKDVPSGRKVDLDVIRAGAPLKIAATLKRGEWSSGDDKFPDLPNLDERLAEKMTGPLFSKAFARAGRGRLGITYTEIDGQLASYFKAPKDTAILINSVVEGSAAEKAGLKAGDLLTTLGNTSIADANDLRDAVSDLEGGQATKVTVWRDGRNVDLTVTVEDQSEAKRDTTRWRKPVS